MALPSSGAISFNQVNVELGLAGTTSINLNQATVRTLFGVASGAISMSNGYGKSNGAVATGGTIVDSGGYRAHIFTSSGTFTVSSNSPGRAMDALLVGGGGGGGGLIGSGGGGGGIVYRAGATMSVTSYSVTVGYGGSGGQASGSIAGYSGGNSLFNGDEAYGGGGGGTDSWISGGNGGCGGGGRSPSSPGAGWQGGGGGAGSVGPPYYGGGGGGAGAVGSGPNGGIGLAYATSGTNQYYADGGAAADLNNANYSPGGGGTGGASNSGAGMNGRGGGGGGVGYGYGTGYYGGVGGTGTVIIRYLYP